MPVLATVALAGGGFVAEAKRMPGVELIVLSRESRDRLAGEIAALLGARSARGHCAAPRGARRPPSAEALHE